MVIKTNIAEMLGIKHPIVAAPMGPFYTTNLTIAVSEAGGLGVLSHVTLSEGITFNQIKEFINIVSFFTDKGYDD